MSSPGPSHFCLTNDPYFGTLTTTMLMIRFQRIGRKNDPAFRMVVLEKTSGPKAGTYVDLVGTYNPKTKAFSADADRIKDWMGKGAQLSPSLMNLLIDKGVLEGKKAAVVSKKNLEKNAKKEEPVVEESPVMAAAVAEAEVVEEEAAPTEEVAQGEEAPVEEPAPAEAPAA